MVNSVTIENGYLIITFNTDSGQEPIRIALTDIFNPNLYYTKQEVDARIASSESKDNKVVIINNDSNDTQYPSAKAVYNYLKDSVARCVGLNNMAALSEEGGETYFQEDQITRLPFPRVAGVVNITMDTGNDILHKPGNWIPRIGTVEYFDRDGNYIGDPNKEPGMWDKDDNVIPMITIEDLWNEVKDLRLKLEGEEDRTELTNTIKDMVELHLKTAAEPVNMDVLKDALGDEWDNIIKFFGKPESMVCVDNSDEAIADIMATYLDNKAPYKTIQCDSCVASIFLDSKVGVLLVLSADDFELYVWQNQ
jgi:hypothetical protein